MMVGTPSIVGKWQCVTPDDFHGTVTLEFRPDGTYLWKSASRLGYRNFKMRQDEGGTYKFAGKTLATVRATTRTYYINSDGTVKNSLPLEMYRHLSYPI